MGQALVIYLNPRDVTCGMCRKTENHDHPDDRKCVPILNGSPTTSEGECDGYSAVCAKCYGRWDAWDSRRMIHNAGGKRSDD